MLPPGASERALRKFFRRRHIGQIADLYQVLESRSRMSVFRRPKAVPSSGWRKMFSGRPAHA